MYRIPSEIDYGIVQNLKYVEDFGRFEAKVLLHLKQAKTRSPNVEFFVNVDARQGENFEDLRLRLVLKAARLYRLYETNLQTPMSEPTTPNLPEAA